MASFKSHPVFYSMLIACGVVALGEAYLIYASYGSQKTELKRLADKQNELKGLFETAPSPNVENKKAIEEDFTHTDAERNKMVAMLQGSGDFAANLHSSIPPAASMDAYFKINQFVEGMRNKMQEAHIAIKPDERFGFSDYSSHGPVTELIQQVDYQRQVDEYILNALVAASPKDLVSVQREQPMTKAALAARDAAIAAAKASGQPLPTSDSDHAEGDIFSVDSRITARVQGFVDTIGFRITFEGQTESLRLFLNKISSFELPLVVRSVEVEPASVLDASAAAPSSSATTPKPIVDNLPSKFTVTVEYIDLVTAPKAEAAPAAKAEAAPTP